MSQPPSLPPVAIPDDLPIERATSREALLEKLHARTNSLKGQRSRRAPRAQATVDQAAYSIGMGHAASTAQHLLGSQTPEQLAEMIKSVSKEGALPDSLARLVPPEVRNLSKKELAKFIRQIQ